MKPLLNSSGNQMYVIRKKRDKSIISLRAISNAIGTPCPGDDNEYLPIVTDDIPDYDPTFSIRTKSEGANEGIGQWEIHYEIKDKTVEDKISAAENAARNQVASLVPPTQDLNKIVMLMLAALLRGEKLTDKENNLKSQILNFADKMNQNDDNLDSIKIDIEAGQKPDISKGWVPVEVAPIIFPVIPALPSRSKI